MDDVVSRQALGLSLKARLVEKPDSYAAFFPSPLLCGAVFPSIFFGGAGCLCFFCRAEGLGLEGGHEAVVFCGQPTGTPHPTPRGKGSPSPPHHRVRPCLPPHPFPRGISSWGLFLSGFSSSSIKWWGGLVSFAAVGWGFKPPPTPPPPDN